jgi:hypothetical protein
MFGINLKTVAILAFASFAVGAVLGWRLESKLCAAHELAREVASLKTQIAARDEAAKRDAVQFEVDQKEIDALNQRIKDAEAKAGNAQCLGPDDTRRLRSIWK